MNKEIERKFLVNEKQWNELSKPNGKQLKQTYLLTDPNKTIRVRVYGEKGFFTIKGKTNGISRTEYEYEIPLQDALELVATYGEVKIEKTRYVIPINSHNWEVDVFEGDNSGLIIAEIELSDEKESFIKPDWVGNEVSHEEKYFNANLQNHPYTKW